MPAPVSIVVEIEIPARSADEEAAQKASRAVNAINYAAACENESLYPVMEAVVAWFAGLPISWDSDGTTRLRELIDIIESTPTEAGVTLKVTNQPRVLVITGRA